MLDAKETVWNFQDYISGHAKADYISGHAKAHLQISMMIWQLV